MVLGLSPPPWPRFSLHSGASGARSGSKPAGEAVFENVAPHTTGAVGAVAGPETRLDCRNQFRIMERAGTGQAVEPGMEAGTRDFQHFAEPTDRPNVAMPGDEGEPHVASRAKKLPLS